MDQSRRGRKKGRAAVEGGFLWVIWSEDKGGWLEKPVGITVSLIAAGRFTQDEARDIEVASNTDRVRAIGIPDPVALWRAARANELAATDAIDTAVLAGLGLGTDLIEDDD